MSWGQPHFLWGLVLPALLAFALRRRGGPQMLPGLARVSVIGARVTPVVGSTARRRWFLPAALAFAVLALAQPRWGVREHSGEEPAREVLIALDLSRSMLVEDVAPSRLQRAHMLVRALLDELRGERVGLIVFAGVAYVQVPLSSDHAITREFLPALEPGYLPQGGTDYAGMLRAAREGFSEAAAGDRYLIVLSDGESTTDGWREELAQLRKKGVTMIALGLGTAQGGDVPPMAHGEKSPARSRLEPATLQALAAETGIYRNASEMLDVPGLLAASVALGKQTRWTKRQAEEPAEQFQWFLIPAFTLGLIGLWREIGVRPRTRAIVRVPARAGFPLSMVAPLLAVSLVAGLLWVRRAWAHEAGHVFGADVTAAQKLQWLVDDLTQHRAIDASDLALLAERTIGYARETLMSGQAVADGAVRDALAAVDFGEKLGPQAADWAALRSELKRLLARTADAGAERPPEEKKEARDEEDTPIQTNGQGSQQTTSESMGQGGVSKTDAALGELQKETGQRLNRSRPVRGSVRPGSGTGDGSGRAPDPLRAFALKRFQSVIKADKPGELFQALSGDARAEAAGGRDW